MAVKNRIAYWRHQKMMDQTEFAKFLGTTQSTINKWEHQKQQPNVNTSFKICAKLEIQIEQLFEYTPDPE